jgi:hypothetical protein
MFQPQDWDMLRLLLGLFDCYTLYQEQKTAQNKLSDYGLSHHKPTSHSEL